jgi:hypothetical protein
MGLELTCDLLYNIYVMTTPDEQRKLIALRMLPSAHRQAKIAAVTEGKTLGMWIEEAIREKVERDKEEGNVTQSNS